MKGVVRRVTSMLVTDVGDGNITMSPTSLSPILGDATVDFIAELSAELTLGAVVHIFGRSYYGVDVTRVEHR